VVISIIIDLYSINHKKLEDIYGVVARHNLKEKHLLRQLRPYQSCGQDWAKPIEVLYF
jgi:hypothetical protein